MVVYCWSFSVRSLTTSFIFILSRAFDYTALISYSNEETEDVEALLFETVHAIELLLNTEPWQSNTGLPSMS